MSTRGRSRMIKVSVNSYRDDKLYPRVAKAVETLLARDKVVASVDVLVEMGLHDPKRVEDWRRGKGPKQHVRFTKTGDPKLEEAYARHFVWPGRGPFHPPLSKQENPRDTGSPSEVQSSPAKERRN